MLCPKRFKQTSHEIWTVSYNYLSYAYTKQSFLYTNKINSITTINQLIQVTAKI